MQCGSVIVGIRLFVPIITDATGRDSLAAIAGTVADERLFSVTLDSSLTSTVDLLKLPVHSPVHCPLLSLDALLRAAGLTDGISVIVLDNANLAQLDGVVVPLLRDLAGDQASLDSKNSTPQYASLTRTSLGPGPETCF